jgi:bifunctional DNase/RNase
MTTAADVGYFEMRIAKVVGLAATERELFRYVVLQEVSGDRRLAIKIGWAEAVSLAAHLMGRNGLAR